MLISANLGFLYRELSLPDAIRAAHGQGFDAVECHWPFDSDPAAVSAALADTGLPMLGLNTVRGNAEAGEFGLAAVPGREAEARAAIDQAIAYAGRIECRNVHVMAGAANGPEAFSAFVDNLSYGIERAAAHGIGLLIEPLNSRDAPGYFLTGMETAQAVIKAVGSTHLKIMFDCYHMQIMGGDLLHTIEGALAEIGHIQFAAVPDRSEPDHGEVDYAWLLPAIEALGYDGYFGAEYKPASGSFGWLKRLAQGY